MICELEEHLQSQMHSKMCQDIVVLKRCWFLKDSWLLWLRFFFFLIFFFVNSSRRSERQLRDDSKIQAWFVLKSFAVIVMVVKIMYLKKIICISSNLTGLPKYTFLFVWEAGIAAFFQEDRKDFLCTCSCKPLWFVSDCNSEGPTKLSEARENIYILYYIHIMFFFLPWFNL